jgi:hypothetical protein
MPEPWADLNYGIGTIRPDGLVVLDVTGQHQLGLIHVCLQHLVTWGSPDVN